ncbi:hypothetical protein AVEN_67366-1 [Araneus ventricosus]|uniref:Reverse transcriptase domain-containing protein n=1 Tax=Araneus ventricosus TaxID=182803 RepID=A0A4Y2T1N7_ARAVE|nr:hypothetical protein AVEN_67366-1 [Araneus ventricosus]
MPAPRLLPGFLENRKYYLIPERRKRPEADLLLSSYFTPTDNREGAGETYDSEADLSSGVHQQPEHGFREGKSVDTAIKELLSKIHTARRDGKHIFVLSIDIKGAFDNLQHRAILKSLDASTCPININRLYQSFLQNRKVKLRTPQGRARKDRKKTALKDLAVAWPCGTSYPTKYSIKSGRITFIDVPSQMILCWSLKRIQRKAL